MNLIQKWNKAGAVLLLCAAGCAVGPDYQRPDLAVPPAWQEGRTARRRHATADMAQWWTAFKDPLLDSLVERAVKSNLDLRIAEARVREERALLGRTASGSLADARRCGLLQPEPHQPKCFGFGWRRRGAACRRPHSGT